MDRGIWAARMQQARERMVTAATTLAKGQADDRVAALAAIQGQDRDVRLLKETEAVADLLEALVLAGRAKPHKAATKE